MAGPGSHHPGRRRRARRRGRRRLGRMAAHFLSLLRPFYGSVLLLLGLSAAAVAIEVIPPLLQRMLIDRVLTTEAAKNPSQQLLVLLAAIVVGLLFVRLRRARGRRVEGLYLQPRRHRHDGRSAQRAGRKTQRPASGISRPQSGRCADESGGVRYRNAAHADLSHDHWPALAIAAIGGHQHRHVLSQPAVGVDHLVADAGHFLRQLVLHSLPPAAATPLLGGRGETGHPP